MEKYRTAILMAGPILFFMAEFILPGGSMDAEARMGIMRAYTWHWHIGHVIILLAFIMMFVWLMDVYGAATRGLAWQSFAGAMSVVFALLGDYAIGVLQLFSIELVQTNPAAAQQVLEFMNGSYYLLAFAYLPTLGFMIGFGLLGWSLLVAGRSKTQVTLLVLAGLLITLGGIIQTQLLFWPGSFALLAFSWINVHAPE